MTASRCRSAGVPFLCLLSCCWALPFNFSGGPDAKTEVFKNVFNFSTFLLNPTSGMLYLGARDTILAVNTNDPSWTHKKIKWDVPENKQKSCVAKGKTEGDCRNYIRLLKFLNDGNIYTCGTYAFDPQCATINVSNFALETAEDGSVKVESGKGKCPFEPSQHYTAVMADGVLYTATTSNFLGTQFDISRATGNEGERIRMEQSISWLSDPEFVSSAFIKENEDNPTGEDDKIYFFFTEVAKEYDFYSKVKVPRVARVCKGDVGGMKTLQKRWTTFLKAQLVCEDRASGQRYNILTDVFTTEYRPGDTSSTLFYGIFTSQWERESLSAVCLYSLEDIKKVMDGPFKELKKTCDNWINPEPIPNPRPGQCITNAMRAEGLESSLKLPDKVLTFVRDHPLMENTVTATPMLVKRGVTYTKIAVTFPQAPAAQRGVAILHLGTDRGELHRVSVLGNKATLLKEVALFTAQEPIQNVLLHKGQVLVASTVSLSALPAESCQMFSSCEECARARSIGCAWRAKEEACAPLLSSTAQNAWSEDVLRQCGTGEARCSPAVKELRVTEGQRLVLRCAPFSLRSCSWQHPADRQTRQLHSDLEVTVSPDSLGSYSCACEEAGGTGREQAPCLRAVYELTLRGPSTSENSALASSRQVVALYLLCVLCGAIIGGSLVCFCRSQPTKSVEKGRDLLPSTDTPQSPSSASLLSEGVLLKEKRNGVINGHGTVYVNNTGLKESAINLGVELDGKEKVPLDDPPELPEDDIPSGLEEFADLKFPRCGAPLAKCEESSI